MMSPDLGWTMLLAMAVVSCLLLGVLAPEDGTSFPRIGGGWWVVARNPDLGPLAGPHQQPVDFSIWQAADGSWQLWSCIRNTKVPGNTRLFYRWQGKSLLEGEWEPMGIAMEADPRCGETPGGLQAPYVLKVAGVYHMFYGDWENICLATSRDGKSFTRQLNAEGKSGMFSEGRGSNTRDPMVLVIGRDYYCYYTAHPNQQGAVYARTSRNLRDWSDSRMVAFGGSAGTGVSSAECPFVLYHRPSRRYYLFRTQRYGADAQTSVYHSTDPLDFGLNNDRQHFLCTLPVAAPEIIQHEAQYYIAALLPDLKGIRMARLEWTPRAERGAAACQGEP
jgi:hypothetical protein